MPANPRRDPHENRCPRGHEMRLNHVEIPPRRVVRRGGVGGWELGVSYHQWICDTCGHRGIPLPASAPVAR